MVSYIHEVTVFPRSIFILGQPEIMRMEDKIVVQFVNQATRPIARYYMISLPQTVVYVQVQYLRDARLNLLSGAVYCGVLIWM